MKINIIYIFAFFTFHSFLYAEGNGTSSHKYIHINMLNLPKVVEKQKYKAVKVAVVDVAFRKSHIAIKEFLYKNDNEVPNNFRDDDKNGYIDDMIGWDFAGNDNDVSVPEHRKADLYHGTYISGIIAKIFTEYFGENAKNYLKIIPVKVYADDSKRGEIMHGYEGIRYAADMGADVICCAWNGGKLRLEDKLHLDYALSKGCIIISTAGNLNTEEAFPPANYEGVYAVAAVDYNYRKIQKSSFSKLYSLSAFGESIYGAHSDADNAYFSDSGTSPAAAIIAACAALLKTILPSGTANDIMTALMNTATPIDSLNTTFAGKLGAGVPNMTKAIEFIRDKNYKYAYFNSQLPKGKILYQKGKSPNTYIIKPFSTYKGIHLLANSLDKKGKIKIVDLNDSVIFNGATKDIKNGFYIEDNGLKIEVDKKNAPKYFDFSYYMETIDSTKLFCSGTTYITVDSGSIEDGSYEANYANNSVCKWVITAPAGKRVQINFDYIDTEIDVDYVWIFEGNSTRPEDILAKFSGNLLPPSITSFTNEVLIWFLTDNKKTEQGWKLNYKFIE